MDVDSPSSPGSRLHQGSTSRAHEHVPDEAEVPGEAEVPEEFAVPEGDEVPEDVPLPEQAKQSYPRGPFDPSLLIYYHDHTARYVWEGHVFFWFHFFIL